MNQAKTVFNWIKDKFGTDYVNSPYGLENVPTKRTPYCFGDTENGFEDGIEIDWDSLEKEMDDWISKTFPKEN